MTTEPRTALEIATAALERIAAGWPEGNSSVIAHDALAAMRAAPEPGLSAPGLFTYDASCSALGSTVIIEEPNREPLAFVLTAEGWKPHEHYRCWKCRQ